MSANDFAPFTGESFAALLDRSDGKPRDILRKAHALIERGAHENWPEIDAEPNSDCSGFACATCRRGRGTELVGCDDSITPPRGALVTGVTHPRFEVMCALLHTFAQAARSGFWAERGYRWERRVERELLLSGFAIRSLPAGSRVLGTFSASGLRHQVDAEIRCERAFVIGEWKSFTGPVPKNELLRFKAVTDDYYEVMSPGVRRASVLRIFGVSGDGSLRLRRYAARHGIALIERSRWPAAVLADPSLRWPGEGPPEGDRRRLAWMTRPMQRVMRHQDDGSMLLECPPRDTAIEALLRLQERWSARLDEQLADRLAPYAVSAEEWHDPEVPAMRRRTRSMGEPPRMLETSVSSWIHDPRKHDRRSRGAAPGGSRSSPSVLGHWPTLARGRLRRLRAEPYDAARGRS